MVNEIRIFFDKDKTKPVINPISFEPVKIGEITRKSLFFSNEIEFPIDLKIILNGEFVKIQKTISNLKPSETKEVIFEFSPTMTITKPIKANLEVELDWIIK